MRTSLTLVAAMMLLTTACNNTGSGSKEEAKSAVADSIHLAEVPASPDFPNAELSIDGMQATLVGKDSVKLSFNFGVKNYELKAQTSDAGTKQCNNSDKGQHIHFILDNKPYTALYEPKHEVTVPVNSEHYLMCFLSRSYHESVKSPAASVMKHFKVDLKGAVTMLDSTKMPMLFYSRPKGDYIGKDTNNLLLDFYPVNVAWGSVNRVKAVVQNETNGRSASFMLDSWKPSFIQGLGTGKASVTLTLVDKDGNPLSGPNTSITRNINLAASEPMK
jgi:hypothetical protein